MANEVFISYSRRDLERVRAIKQEIDRSVGIDCWMDLDGIESGDEFMRVIISAIKRHQTVLFMLSENSVKSEWALDELDFAKKEGKRIVLVDLDHTKMPDDFWFRYHKYDTIDWQSAPQHDKLIRNLQKWFGKPASTPKPTSDLPKVEKSAAQTSPKRSSSPSAKLEKVSISPRSSEPANNISAPSHKWLYIGIGGAVVVLLLLVFLFAPKSMPAINEEDITSLNDLPHQPRPSDNARSTICPDNNHPHVIDLGLPSGTKWACCNVGASKPEDYGELFAWGETSTKSDYNFRTYRWCNGDNKMTKYTTRSYYHYITADNRTQLELSDDAARANWLGSWRMPTIEEIKELTNNCYYTWNTVNGVKGGWFTSCSNGHSIFLPAGEYGRYWSSSLDESDQYDARSLLFNSDGANTDSYSRPIGLSVRPVVSN